MRRGRRNCGPDTIGLPDPASLNPARKGKRTQVSVLAAIDPADVPLFNALRDWRARASDGKPAYTVAHNSTLESIAALRPWGVDVVSGVEVEPGKKDPLKVREFVKRARAAEEK